MAVCIKTEILCTLSLISFDSHITGMCVKAMQHNVSFTQNIAFDTDRFCSE